METKKIALITGANKGIGFETARQLGSPGHTVLIGARDKARGEEAAATLRKENINARFLWLDVTDEGTIHDAVRTIDAEHGKLDILINNAGIFLEKYVLPTQLELKALRQTFEVNFFGIFALTQALLPLLRKSDAARIVNVSSGQGSLLRASMAESPRLQLAYNASKAALNALTIQFAKELKDTPIRINSAAPGYTATDMNEGKGSRTAEQASNIIVKLALLDEQGISGGFFEDTGEVPW